MHSYRAIKYGLHIFNNLQSFCDQFHKSYMDLQSSNQNSVCISYLILVTCCAYFFLLSAYPDKNSSLYFQSPPSNGFYIGICLTVIVNYFNNVIVSLGMM